MGYAKYLVAKYVPDVFRNEPVNIGVLTWIDGEVGWKFIGQREEKSTAINGKTQGITGRIKSVQNYKQWIESWVLRLQAPQLHTRHHGTVNHSSPDFLNALATYGEGSYILEPGGELAEDVDPKEINEVTNHLFATLVGMPDEKESYKSPEEVRDELLRDASVGFDDRVKRDQPVELRMNGKQFRPRFSVYIGNGDPHALGLMVPLTAPGKAAQNSARAAELLFVRVLDQGLVPQDRCAAFVYTRDDDENPEIIHDSLEELSLVSTVIDITQNRRFALEKLSKWVSETKPH
jgi:hypothetical protein